jgi:hypothetical protein
MKKITTLILACVAFAGVSQAQVKTPQPSPAATVKQTFGLGEVTVVYSRPVVKGRTIFGDLVPFDKLWRTGANASTKISFTDDVKIDGQTLAAGDYSLFTIPGKAEWTVIINKDLKSGTADYKAENDALRFKVKPQALPYLVESFTIDASDVQANSLVMNISWEKTRVSFKVETDIDAKIMSSIDKTLNPKPEANTYFAAASYYYESGKDMNQALSWVNKATEMNKDAFWMMHLKAKILKKMNDVNGAVAAANASKESAKKAGNDDYVALNDKLIAEMTQPAAAPAKAPKKK